MGLFKEIMCTHCGKKTNMLTRAKLRDGSYLCSKCAAAAPTSSSLCEGDYQDYLKVLEYMEESKNKLAKEFHETHRFQSIHIDTQHKLFYLDDVYPTVYLKFENLEEFNMNFAADEVKTGMLSTKVTGKIFYKVKVSFPTIFIDQVLARDVKATAKVKSGIFSDKVVYDNPKGMDDFLHYFAQAWQTAIDEKSARLIREVEEKCYNTQCDYDSYQTTDQAHVDELQQAMALFMIDDLSAVTLDDIKAQRNRLIKVYHPDVGDSTDTSFAQKINNAYEILKSHLS